MITAGERLRQLAGRDGAAGSLLLAIGAGATAGAILAGRSGLGSAAAWRHLLAEAPAEAAANASLPSRSLRRRRGPATIIEPARARRRDDILIWGHRWL